MKMSCPACGSLFSLDVLLTQESARSAVMAALALPAPLGKLLIQYIALFRPNQRQLSFDRVARLLEELHGPITEARIERNGRIWPAPQDTWKAALTDMLAMRDAGKLRLPLNSHGYLFEIIASTADRIAGKQEVEEEARRRRAPALGERAEGMQTFTQAVTPQPRESKPAPRSKPTAEFLEAANRLKKGGSK